MHGSQRSEIRVPIREPGAPRRRQHIDRGQQRREQQRARADPGDPAGLRRRDEQIPLAHKAVQRRQSHQRERGNREARERDRHAPPDPVELKHAFAPGFMQHRAGAEERNDLDAGVRRNVQQRGRKAGRRHQHRPEQDVAEVGDRRIREPPLEMRFPHRERRAVNDRERGKQQRGRLRPGARKQLRPVAILRQADHRKRAGLDDRNGVQQRGDGRRRDRGLDQPAVQREERRLDRKAEESEQPEEPRDPFPAEHFPPEDSARCERSGSAVREQIQHGDKRERGTADRIQKICARRFAGGRRHRLQNQRNG